jgi:deazaflavin-dependent oxidoreductase (nitroreductase family)
MDHTAEVTRAAPRRALRLPWSVRLFGPILKLLLDAGVPLGPNRLITIPGRKTGLPRRVGLAVIPMRGRRWVWAPWGEVNWVRNLRAARRATITFRGRKEEVSATELDEAERVEFFRDIYGPLARSIPFGYWLVRLVDRVDINQPVEVARDRRVFELHPSDKG